MGTSCEIDMDVRRRLVWNGNARHGAKQFVFGVACTGWYWLSDGHAIADGLRDQWFKFEVLHDQ